MGRCGRLESEFQNFRGQHCNQRKTPSMVLSMTMEYLIRLARAEDLVHLPALEFAAKQRFLDSDFSRSHQGYG